jgi:hypothetical protein
MRDGERAGQQQSVDSGFIEWDQEMNRVRKGPEFGESEYEQMETVLRATDVLDEPAVVADGSTDRSLDRMFDVLRHPYRRRILMLVSEHNPRDENEFSVDALATEDDDLELLTTELFHVHLPKLAEAGYIEWDEDTHTIRRGPNLDEIAPLLRLIDDHQDELPEGWP